MAGQRLKLRCSNCHQLVSGGPPLKECDDLTITSSTPTTIMAISNDSISTSDWQEMSIFEKVTVFRALYDVRLKIKQILIK